MLGIEVVRGAVLPEWIDVNEPYVITSQLLAYDSKRIHQIMRMYHAETNFLAATAEWLNLHVDLDIRKVSPWPDPIVERIAAFAARQGDWGWPPEAGERSTANLFGQG
jgi:acyl-CoA thioester hydrolase